MRNCWKSPIQPWARSVFYGQDFKVVFFSELHHVSCLTLLALTDTKWHTLGRGPSWLIRHAVTYTLPLKGAQLNDPRGQKKNKGIAGGVKPFLPPEAKPTIFTVFRKTWNRADVFPLKKGYFATHGCWPSGILLLFQYYFNTDFFLKHKLWSQFCRPVVTRQCRRSVRMFPTLKHLPSLFCCATGMSFL